MKEQRWLRIIPVALIMYTISYVDRTNVALALTPNISSMMKDLGMNFAMAGRAGGIFFIGYVLLQIPGGYFARRWSARKVVSLCLVAWGVCAMACGLSRTFRQFETARFFLGVAESGVYPATIVLLYHWFPRAERARATAYWNLCQPLAVAASAPVTGWLLGAYGWQKMLMFEGILPFMWLPIWWFLIRDHPREAKWLSSGEREFLETSLRQEAAEQEPAVKVSLMRRLIHPSIFVMIALYFLHNCAAYGCMTFFSDGLKLRYTGVEYGFLLAVPYAVTAVVMILISRHSDKTRERRHHVAFVYGVSGVSLILSVLLRQHFWTSYVFLCLAIPGPFSGMAPFWANAGETVPVSALGAVVGLVNAFGNLGGYEGQKFVGWMKDKHGDTALAFILLGIGMLGCTVLAFFLPKAARASAETLHTRPMPAAGDAP